MAHCAPSFPLTSAVGVSKLGTGSKHGRVSLVSDALGGRKGLCVLGLRSSGFLGNVGIVAGSHRLRLKETAHKKRTVCLFGRGKRGAPQYAQEEAQVYIEKDYGAETAPMYIEREYGAETVPMVEQAVRLPVASTPNRPPLAALIAAVVFAGFAFLAVTLANHLRGLPPKGKIALAGSEEDAEALISARARLGQAFGEDSNEYGEVKTKQIAGMMDSAADYLYALAHEVADVRALLDDREERLGFAVERSKQDAHERKELIRRISIAEADLVEEQLKQAAEKATADARAREIEEEKAAEVERLIMMHQAELNELRLQFEQMERDAEATAATVKKLSNEVLVLKQGLKEKEAQLAAAAKKADEDKERNLSLSARLDATTSELQAARSRETELKASLQETASGVEGAERQLERMQSRHESEIRAVRGIALAQAKGLEERLRSAQERVEEVQALKAAEVAAREAAEATAQELQSQVDQLEQDLIFLESRYKEALVKAETPAPPAENPAQTEEIEALKEALESKTQQAQVAKELVLQFMENEREKDFELKQLKREADIVKERLGELEAELEVAVAARIEGALDGPGEEKRDDDGGARGRTKLEEQLEGFRAESEREVVALRAELRGARAQLARAQKQHAAEMETKLGKQEREFRAKLVESQSERDGCLVKLGTLEGELEREVKAREAAQRELSGAHDQLLEWERRSIKIEAAHTSALEAERETSRQKLEALFLDYETAREDAREKENQRIALVQRTEELQAALADAKSKRKLQAAKANDEKMAIALNEDIVEEARAKQSRFEAELEALANQHATHVKSLEDARAADAAAAQKEQERLQNEVALQREQIQALQTAVEEAERENEEVRMQVAKLEAANADAAQQLERTEDLRQRLSAAEADAELQGELQARVADLDDVIRANDDVIAAKDDVIRGLEAELARADELEDTIRAKNAVIRGLEAERARAAELSDLIRAKDDVIAARDVVIRGLEAERARVAELDEVIRAKDNVIWGLEAERARAAQLDDAIRAKDDVIQGLEAECERAAELDDVIRAKDDAIAARDEVIRELEADLAAAAELDDVIKAKDDIIRGLEDERERAAKLEDVIAAKNDRIAANDDIIRGLEAERERAAELDDVIKAKDDVIRGLERERERAAELEDVIAAKDDRIADNDDVIRGLEAERERAAELDDVIAAKDYVIRVLEAERAAAVAESLRALEEADTLREKVRTLLEEQDGALEAVRANAMAGDEELTRVRQRLAEVERALEGSQEELRGARLEEDRLTLELAAAKTSAQEQQKAHQQTVDGLERALQASGSELQRSTSQERELNEGLQRERKAGEGALQELQEREEAIAFFQRYFEERSSLDVQLFELGRLYVRLEAAKREAAAADSKESQNGNGPQDVDGAQNVSSLEAEFSALLRKFECAVAETAATFGEWDSSGVRGLPRGLRRVQGSRNGVPAPRALDLVGVDEVAEATLADLSGRLLTAEQKAAELQTEIRQRVVRQMEWQDYESDGSTDGVVESEGDDGATEVGRNIQNEEIQKRVAQMMQTLSEEQARSKER